MDAQTFIIGLGNPGLQYSDTRHNAGLLLCDALMEHDRKLGGLTTWDTHKKTLQTSLLSHTTHRTMLVNLGCFMNVSGAPTRSILDYYKADPEIALIVAYDDLDLPLGTWKISRNKNASGHNGLQDIITHVGTKDFLRIRIGIDARTPDMRTHIAGRDYVLGHFTADERIALDGVFTEITDYVFISHNS